MNCPLPSVPAKQTVLIVDDVPENIDVLASMLRSDHQVKAARDGSRALAIALSDTPPDLILLDIMMPGLDGHQVCRRLRADARTQEVPVIFITALDDVKSKIAGFEAGGTDYITKPFEPLEVTARVRSLLDAKSFRDTVRGKLKAELQVARELQRSLLPNDFDSLMAHLPVEVHAILEPAREVGGDLYLIVPIGDDKLLAAIGDVSGKGIPAAMSMTMTTTLVRALARLGLSPQEIVTRLNRELAFANSSDTFVTLFCGLLDLATGSLLFVNAGHNPPSLLRLGDRPRCLEATGPMVGVFEDAEFEEQMIELEPEDLLVAYTDGVTEARNPEREMFGEERLATVLEECTEGSARGAVEATIRAVRRFVRDSAQSDDIATLALRYCY